MFARAVGHALRLRLAQIGPGGAGTCGEDDFRERARENLTEARRLQCSSLPETKAFPRADWNIEMPRDFNKGPTEYGWARDTQADGPAEVEKDRRQSDPVKFLQFAANVFDRNDDRTVFAQEGRTLRVWVVCCHGQFMRNVVRHAIDDASRPDFRNYDFFVLRYNPVAETGADALSAGPQSSRWQWEPDRATPRFDETAQWLVLVRHCPRVCQGVLLGHDLLREHRVKDPPCQEETPGRDMLTLYLDAWAGLINAVRRLNGWTAKVCISSSCLRRAQQTARQFAELIFDGLPIAPTIAPVFWAEPMVLTGAPGSRWELLERAPSGPSRPFEHAALAGELQEKHRRGSALEFGIAEWERLDVQELTAESYVKAPTDELYFRPRPMCTIPIVPYCKETLNHMQGGDYKDLCSTIRTIVYNESLLSGVGASGERVR